MRKRRIVLAPEMLDASYAFGVTPRHHSECSCCGRWPTTTGNSAFPKLWLFKSHAAANHFKATGECADCQDAQ
jgi:hypothetical protein